MTTLVIIAKEPLPGKAKTRLHPAVSLEDAALLAAAAIDDTLRRLADVPATRRVLYYQGDVLPPRSEGYDVVRQREGTLDERLAHLFDEVGEPLVLVGMDTPQVSADDLAPAFASWPVFATGPGAIDCTHDAWFGPAEDGGFWALGMREPRGDLIRGVEMSRDDTGHRQLMRLTSAGLRVGMLRPLADVDTIDTALEVADLVPDSAFASTLRSVHPRELAVAR